MRLSHRPRRTSIGTAVTATLAALALVLTGTPAVAGGAHGDDHGGGHGGGHGGDHGGGHGGDHGGSGGRHGVPDDQPLPGYTIVNPPLTPLVVDGKAARVFQGVHQHAAYDVEVPADWNGELVMWAHGYAGTGKVLGVDVPPYGLRQTYLEQGYAWAASSYATNDYNVATGVTTTRGLADKATRLLGRKPARTYIAGVSMGGHVIARSLEQYPSYYDGAMPLCGVLGDQELFDYFLSFNLVAQDLTDRPSYPPPADYYSVVAPQIQQELGLDGLAPGGPDTTNERGKQLRDITTELTGGERPGAQQAFSVWQDFLFTLFTPDTGGPLRENAGRVAQNVDTVYTPDAPVDVNASVRRVAPTDLASRRTDRLTEIPRVKGRPQVPTITLHGLGDLFVPFSMEQVYGREVARNHQSNLLVQRAIRAAGHCEFTPTEVGTAWNDLTAWVESLDARHEHGHGHGRGHGDDKSRGHRHGNSHGNGHGHGHGHGTVARPAGDDVLTAATVASPTYGCTFTDPTGYLSPQYFPTRALYAPCPG